MALLPEPLLDHVRSQFGLVNRAQALETLSQDALRSRLRSGLLVPVGRGLYRLHGFPPSWRQRALASCMMVGGEVAVSHLAAAYLWRAESVAAPQVQLTVAPWRRPRVVHPTPHRLALPAQDITDRWGIPTTTAARTIIDLSTIVDPPLLGRIIDDLCRSRQLRVEDLDRRLADARSGCGPPLPRHRASSLHEILRPRIERGRGPGASPREDWMVDAILRAGLPAPVRNLIVEIAGGLRELDLAYPDQRIAIEYDGWQVHADATHFHRDREKASILALDGWITLQVTSAWTETVLVQRVRSALTRRDTHRRSF